MNLSHWQVLWPVTSNQLVMSVCLPSNPPYLQPAANSTGVRKFSDE